MKTTLLSFGIAFASAAVLPAFTPAVNTLHSRATGALAGNAHGTSVAANDRFMVVGEPGNSDAGADAGAVWVYDAVTGNFLRRLAPSDGLAGFEFGSQVAVSGTRVVVTAVMASSAYVFDLPTGKQLHKLTPAGVTGGFGYRADISGTRVAVSAWLDDDEGNNAGAVYVYDLNGAPTTMTETMKLTASDAGIDDRFGVSVALQGRLLAIGAERGDGVSTNTGAVYVHDVVTGDLVRKVFAADGALDDDFGISVAIDGKYLLVGAQFADGAVANAGACYLYDLNDGSLENRFHSGSTHASARFGAAVALRRGLALAGAWLEDEGSITSVGAAYLMDPFSVGPPLRRLLAPDYSTSSDFGRAVALGTNAAVIGAPGDSRRATEAGAAYLYRSISGPLPMRTVARISDSAPEAGEASLATFGKAAIGPQGSSVFISKLKGLDSDKNRDDGAWSDLSSISALPGPLLGVLKRREPLDGFGGVYVGTQPAAMSDVIFNDTAIGLVRGSLTGTNVTSGNNQFLARFSPTSVVPLLRTGDALGLLGGAVVSAFEDVVQSTSNFMAVRYRLKTGTALVSKANDAGWLAINTTSAAISRVEQREGEIMFGLDKYGEFFKRISIVNDHVGFACYRLSVLGTPPVQQLITREGSNAITDVATNGDEILGPGNPLLSSFFAEMPADDGSMYFRASLMSGGATAKNNEGIWRNTTLLMRKGQAPDPSAPSVVVSRFLGMWPYSSDRLMVLVQLTGAGVKPTNDCALYLRQEDGSFLLLLREGSSTLDADGASIGVIQRVICSPYGKYAVLCSLTGSATSNQALFTGDFSIGNATNQKALRQPGLHLRKGTLHQPATGTSTRIRSLNLFASPDTSGASLRGVNNTIAASGLIMSIQFDNNAVELVAGAK